MARFFFSPDNRAVLTGCLVQTPSLMQPEDLRPGMMTWGREWPDSGKAHGRGL